MTTEESKAERVKELLDKFDLNWKVLKVPLVTMNGEPTHFFGTQRDDTKEVFTTVKGGYTIYQNTELAELVTEVAGTIGFEVEHGGHLKGGAKVFIQIVTNEIEINQDKIKGYLTALNTHDATMGARWGNSNTTISCENTFNSVAKQLSNSARHTSDIRERIQLALKETDILIQKERTTFDNFLKFSNIEAKQADIHNIVMRVTGVDLNINSEEAQEEYSSYQLNRAQELCECIQSEMKQKGETLWGLMSGVTYYTSHKMRVDANNEEARALSKMFGRGSEIDNEAYNELVYLLK